jgi:(2Fe-2S) ferredoxin
VGAQAGTIALPGTRVGRKKMWVAAVMVAVLAGGLTAGLVMSLGKAPAPSRPLPPALRDWYANLTQTEVDRLVAAGYTGRLGGTTVAGVTEIPGVLPFEAERSLMQWYAALSQAQVDRLIQAGYTGRLGGVSAASEQNGP